MEKRDNSQQRIYADRRMTLAIDRLLEARTDSEREKASKWAYAWRHFSQGVNHAAVPRPRFTR